MRGRKEKNRFFPHMGKKRFFFFSSPPWGFLTLRKKSNLRIESRARDSRIFPLSTRCKHLGDKRKRQSLALDTKLLFREIPPRSSFFFFFFCVLGANFDFHFFSRSAADFRECVTYVSGKYPGVYFLKVASTVYVYTNHQTWKHQPSNPPTLQHSNTPLQHSNTRTLQSNYPILQHFSL